MLYASALVIILMICLFTASLRTKADIPVEYDKKEHRLYFLYPMAERLLSITGLKKRLLNKTDISGKIRALYVTDRQEYQVRLYWYKRVSLFIIVVFVLSGFLLIESFQETLNRKAYDNTIKRPGTGQGDRQLVLSFLMINEVDSKDVYEDSITINNKERKYTDDEWDRILESAIPYIERNMPGENVSLEHVDKDLNFIKEIPGTGITVDWIPEDPRLISEGGRLITENIPDGGADTLVTAILRHNDKKVEHTVSLTVWPENPDKKEQLYNELEEIIDSIQDETAADSTWKLPLRIRDYLITWHEPKSSKALQIFMIGIAGTALLWIFMNRSLDDRMKARNNQMLIDYPEIINKFILLVNAGMTVRQAWFKIAEDYERNIKPDGNLIRYAYEEMLMTMHELKLGVPEASAYEQFGMRAGLLPFMKFSSILVQNLKKGNRNMVDLLRQEAAEAFQERKETVKKLGEEASTKLLGPMIILLFMVLAIILIPAFISFRI